MNSLERMMAAIHGEPFDRYPFINPYPTWSMLPHWPEIAGVTWLHTSYASDQDRLRYFGALRDRLGLDWMPVPGGETRIDEHYSVDMEGDVPVLVDLRTGGRTRMEELPIDRLPTKRQFKSARDVETLPAPATAEEILAGSWSDMTRLGVERYGDEIFLHAGAEGPFSACFRALTFEGVFETVMEDPDLIHAISQRHVETITQHARASAALGVHGMRINEYPCGAELLSEEHYLELVFPYEQQLFRAIKEAGLVPILEYLGWVEPRLPHIARLDIDCLQTESSLKGYRNDVGTYRRHLGQEVCIFSNSPILDVIERGHEDTWRRDAAEQARGIGEQGRFCICAGSPTTWATGPDRLREYGEFMRDALAELVPPRG